MNMSLVLRAMLSCFVLLLGLVTAKYEAKPFPLPVASLNGLMSRETIDYHFGQHYQGYVQKFNKAEVKGSITDLIKAGETPPKILNLVQQIYNHEFFFDSLTSREQSKISFNSMSEEFTSAMKSEFGSMSDFETRFTKTAKKHFGSGWVWLVYDPTMKKLMIVEGHDAGNPLRQGMVPLLTVDVWEHAYYIDFRNKRAAFLEKLFGYVNWTIVSDRYTAAISTQKTDL